MSHLTQDRGRAEEQGGEKSRMNLTEVQKARRKIRTGNRKRAKERGQN